MEEKKEYLTDIVQSRTTEEYYFVKTSLFLKKRNDDECYRTQVYKCDKDGNFILKDGEPEEVFDNYLYSDERIRSMHEQACVKFRR